MSSVCPPETSSARCGVGGGDGREGSSRYTAARWPARWFTPTTGRSIACPTALAVSTPTSSAPTNPGPQVTAIPSICDQSRCASSSARRRTGTIVATCWREATSGTTPPYWAWTRTCEATTSERTRRPSSTTAAAVSSHEVSIPRTFIFLEAPHDGSQLRGVSPVRREAKILKISGLRLRVATTVLVDAPDDDVRVGLVRLDRDRLLRELVGATEVAPVELHVSQHRQRLGRARVGLDSGGAGHPRVAQSIPPEQPAAVRQLPAESIGG